MESYDWEYFEPLREDVEYRVEGSIIEAERTVNDIRNIVDRVAFQIEMYDGETLAARVTNCWKFRRELFHADTR